MELAEVTARAERCRAMAAKVAMRQRKVTMLLRR